MLSSLLYRGIGLEVEFLTPCRCSLFSAARICSGRYFDGFFSRPCNVSVRLTSEKLAILFDHGDELDWTDTAKLVSFRKASVVLACDNQRLTVECRLGELPRALLERKRNLRSAWLTAGLSGLLALWALAIAVVVLPWSSDQFARHLSPQFHYIDAYERFERTVARIPKAKNSRVSYCNESAGSRALLNLVWGLTNKTPLRWEPKIVVVETSSIRALAMGAGIVLITSGMLSDVENQTELAAVLTHEIGHNEFRHAIRMPMEVSSLFGLMDFLFNSTIGRWSVLLVGRGNYIPFRSRQGEREADSYSIERLLEADMNPGVHVNLLSRHEGRNGSWFATHPSRKERIDMFYTAARPGSDILTPEEWRALKSICRTTTKTAPVSPPEPS